MTINLRRKFQLKTQFEEKTKFEFEKLVNAKTRKQQKSYLSVNMEQTERQTPTDEFLR